MFGLSRKSCSLSIIGDTHLRHRELKPLEGDVLIHVGDFFDLFNPDQGQVAEIDAWFAEQEFDLILCVAGNHDFPLERRRSADAPMFENATYLEDQGIEYNGLKFFGSPWVPYLPDHAFYADDMHLGQKWAGIPEDTDVLITHTPPAGILDRSSSGMELGCPLLLKRVDDIRPLVHCFGHVHASGGTRQLGKTKFVNASSFIKEAQPLRKPVRVRV